MQNPMFPPRPAGYGDPNQQQQQQQRHLNQSTMSFGQAPFTNALPNSNMNMNMNMNMGGNQPQGNTNANNGSPWFTQSQPSGNMYGSDMMSSGPSYNADDEDYENEPPLLEELGINFDHIWTKTQSVLIPTKVITEHILDDTDLAGPLVYCFIFGMCLLLAAKVHFGYIYGFGGMGCLFVYLLLNLMSLERSIDIYRVCSVLGYCLLPIIGLAALNIILSIKNLGMIGFALGFVCIIWSTHTATRFFEKALHMSDQKYLIAFPVGLVYSCFVLITVF